MVNSRFLSTTGAYGRMNGLSGVLELTTRARSSPSSTTRFEVIGQSTSPSIHGLGIPIGPTRAPTIPTTIAAIVSVSPPHRITPERATRRSAGLRNHACRATGTLSKQYPPGPRCSPSCAANSRVESPRMTLSQALLTIRRNIARQNRLRALTAVPQWPSIERPTRPSGPCGSSLLKRPPASADASGRVRSTPRSRQSALRDRSRPNRPRNGVDRNPNTTGTLLAA